MTGHLKPERRKKEILHQKKKKKKKFVGKFITHTEWSIKRTVAQGLRSSSTAIYSFLRGSTVVGKQ